MNGNNQHVYKAAEESMHNLNDTACVCAPEIIRQRPEDGLVIVHRELRA